MKLVECVPNFSVGNDNQIIDKIASSIQSIKVLHCWILTQEQTLIVRS